MRHLKLLALCAALHAFVPAAHAGDKVWISLGDAAYAQLQKHVPLPPAASARVASRVVGETSDESVHLVQVDEAQMLTLSHSVHETLGRCGGFMVHASQAEGLATLQRHADASALMRVQAQATRPSYAIDQQSVVTPMLAQMQASNIGQTIVDLSTNFVNRYYNASTGVGASNWLKNRWTTLANGRSDITVEQFAHPNWLQKSVIATIKGTDNSSEVVVIGGHLDSINKNGTNETTVAPGADDDASGVASLTEVLRVLASSNYKPKRTLKFMAYAAEEVGLRGSQEIAKSFAAAGTNVVGVMQLDMTNFKGSANDIYFVTDYTDSPQTTFASDLVKTYLPTLRVGR
jgi:bacterial leucyl aminopeptidase